jgi:TATA-box binding protein (TBP) (component of TFIID and TFIIIB)
MNASFDYILQVNAIRQEILKRHPERPPPSWVRITTITMCSKFLQEIDLKKFRENFTKLGSVTVRRQGSRFRGFEWKMKDTAFYNQVTIGYEDQYSRKSIKIFPNGSIQVAGCSDLFDCRRILGQLSFILKVVLGLESDAPIGDISVKMINTNFSLNSSVNLHKIIAAFSSSPNQARINYLDEQISHYRPIIEGIERILAGSEATLLDLGPGGQFRRKVLEASIREDKKSLEEHVKIMNEFITERGALGDKAPEGKFKVTFDPDRYSAVKLKFTPREGQKQVTASIFSTGKIIVTGAQTLEEIAGAYELINQRIDASILVKPVAEPELFETIMGARFEEWVRVLNKTVANKM